MTERELDIHKIELRDAKFLAEFYANRINKYVDALNKVERNINHHAEQIKQLEESK